jgi:hypothetical protein
MQSLNKTRHLGGITNVVKERKLDIFGHIAMYWKI